MPQIGDLTKCKIYKITSLNNPELVYYGHTCHRLSHRLAAHKGPSNKTKSKIIIEKGDAVIILVEDYPCESGDQARAREAFYISNNPCVNKQIPGRTPKQYYEANKEQLLEKQNQYNQINKDQKHQYDKEYYDAKREQILEQKKIYHEANKERILEYQKQYREKRKLLKNNIEI